MLKALRTGFRERPYLYWGITILIVSTLLFVGLTIIAAVVIGLVLLIRAKRKKSNEVIEYKPDQNKFDVEHKDIELKDIEPKDIESEDDYRRIEKEAEEVLTIDTYPEEDIDKLLINTDEFDGVMKDATILILDNKYMYVNFKDVAGIKDTEIWTDMINIHQKTKKFTNLGDNSLLDVNWIIDRTTNHVIGYMIWVEREGEGYLECLGLDENYINKPIVHSIVKDIAKYHLKDREIFHLNDRCIDPNVTEDYKTSLGCTKDRDEEYRCNVNEFK